jgi:hypothetical protein
MTETVEEKLARFETVIGLQMQEIDRLRAENERLRSAAGAHDVLKNIYSDVSQPTTHRIKAAGIAIGHESPSLKPVEAPLELVAEEVEPLAVVVQRQRARADRILALPLEERERMVRGVVRDGNGQDGD